MSIRLTHLVPVLFLKHPRGFFSSKPFLNPQMIPNMLGPAKTLAKTIEI